MKRTTQIALVFALFTMLTASSAIAQTTSANDQPSLGDYARKVQKTPTAKAKPKVFDNDNLPKDDQLSSAGVQMASNTSDNAAGEPSSASGDAPKPEDDPAKKQAEWKEWQEKIGAQKNSIDLASRELDVLQKEYQLRAAAMYADVGNRLRNSGEWDKEDGDYKQKIADKQKAVDDAKQKLEDMQEDARKAGVPAAMREPQ